jgi:hypothetical protein
MTHGSALATPWGMTILAQMMPVFRMRQIDHVAVEAPPQEAWAALEAFDASSIPFVRWLFDLRLVPARIEARLRGGPPPPRARLGLRDVGAPGTGFHRLGERAGRELCVGAIGKFWQPDIEFAARAKERFVDFAEPGFGRLAWSLRVDPRVGGGSWITFELRVGATDDGAWAKFRRYWLLIGQFSHLIRRGMLARFEQLLGAAPPSSLALPGDEILSAARFVRTQARVIEAPVEQVFPWLAQMGATRAGWYSIDAIDNGGVKSAEVILPELQRLRPGDVIPALPKRPGGFRVLAVDPPRSLVIGSPSLAEDAPAEAWPPWRDTWAFALEPIGDDACRLITRVRAEYASGVKLALITAFMSGAHALMGRVQLHNIKRRAEDGVAA